VILRSADGALHLITQPDHAALAGRIMQHWMSLATQKVRKEKRPQKVSPRKRSRPRTSSKTS
jgi:hypothetical protein